MKDPSFNAINANIINYTSTLRWLVVVFFSIELRHFLLGRVFVTDIQCIVFLWISC